MNSILAEMYSPLNEENNEIRTILLHPKEGADDRLVCSLETISLNDTVERGRQTDSIVGGFLLNREEDRHRPRASAAYEAVSYTWGAAGNTRTILLDNQEFHVGQNLWLLLHDFRVGLTTQKGPARLWIDAICINQQDLGEKGLQIPKMKAIYELAQRVIVWLGPRTDDSDLAMQLLLPRGKKPWHGRRAWQFMDEDELMHAKRIGLDKAFRSGNKYAVKMAAFMSRDDPDMEHTEMDDLQEEFAFMDDPNLDESNIDKGQLADAQDMIVGLVRTLEFG